MSAQPEKKYVCPTCGEVKARHNTLFYHMKKHTEEKKYVCADCNKGFYQKSGLDQHRLQIHASENAPVFKCPLCDYTNKLKSGLQSHIGRKHSDGWFPRASTSGPTVCGSCSKECASGAAYYYHAVKCYAIPEKLEAQLLPLLGAKIKG